MSLAKYRSKHDDDKKRAAIAGGGVMAGKTGVDLAIEAARDLKEKNFAKSKTMADFTDNLKPGDVLFSRFDRESSMPIKIGSVDSPFKNSDLLQLFTGSPNYHGAMYAGRGHTYEAGGAGGGYERMPIKESVGGHEVMAYRPTRATEQEIAQAMLRAKGNVGKRYPKFAELAKQGLSNFAGLSPPSNCKIGAKGSVNCTSSVANALPKQFDKLYMTPDEMRAVPGMELVSKYNRSVPELNMLEKAAYRTPLKLARNLKYGAGAALGTYLLSKALNGDEDVA
jgi:hypothetical protein